MNPTEIAAQVAEIARTHIPRESVNGRLPECDACSTYEPIAHENCPAPVLLAVIRAQAERLARAHTGHKYTHGITGEVTYCCPAHQDGYTWLEDARAEAAT